MIMAFGSFCPEESRGQFGKLRPVLPPALQAHAGTSTLLLIVDKSHVNNKLSLAIPFPIFTRAPEIGGRHADRKFSSRGWFRRLALPPSGSKLDFPA